MIVKKNMCMKRILLALFALIILFSGITYLVIPGEMIAQNAFFVSGHPAAAERHLVSRADAWSAWCAASGERKAVYQYNNYQFEITGIYTGYDSIKISTPSGAILYSQLNFLPVSKDSFLIQWTTLKPYTAQPLLRWKNYFLSRELGSVQEAVLNQFITFIHDTSRVYEAPISRQIVKDTLLLETSRDLNHRPATSEIYELIDALHETIRKQQGSVQDSAMLNVTALPDNQYRLRVALPIRHEIKPGSGQAIKRMVEGYILVMDRKGGPYSIQRAAQMLDQFVKDGKLTSPAIPFEKLLTNRMAVRDTLQWTTRFYYPVM